MSRTTRHVDPSWVFGTPAFEKWNEHIASNYVPGLSQRPIKSKKDQEKDRKGKGKQGGKFGRFVKGTKNSRYNLVRKYEKDDFEKGKRS